MVKKMKKSKKRVDAIQKPGKLMLNNPLIPPELDEDIDDDLAFDSDDEKLYGHFFNKSAPKEDKRKKTSKRGEDIALHQLDHVDNFSSGGEEEGSDNEEFIDLSDMMDMNIKEERKKKKKKTQVRQTEDGSLVAKKRRTANVTDEAESIYGMSESGVDGTADSYGSAMLNYMGGADADGTDDQGPVSARLRHTLRNKHNVIAMDEDDHVKDRLDRKEVRSLVEENMKKYKPLLHELSTSKHVQFPMKPPGSVATARSTGGLVAAAEQRFQNASPKEKSNSTAVHLASKMDALLTKLEKKPREELNGNQFGEVVEFDQHGENDEADGEEAAPTTGYMSKLKSMLAIENSRRKRFKKIKSKTYRRILRKEKEREKEKKQKAFELLHPELARQKMTEKLLKARAEERVTQKHKNTSAWVKHAKRFVQYDENAKDAVNEQLMLHQQLMQKMEDDAGEEYYNTYAEDERSNASSEEEERVVDELLADSSKGNTGKVTSVLWKAIEGEASEEAEGSAASPIAKARAELKEMKFMKQSKERREKEMREDVDHLAEDIRRYQQDPNATFEGDEDIVGDSEATNTFTGRRKFAAAKKDATNIVQQRQKGIDAERLAKMDHARDPSGQDPQTASDDGDEELDRESEKHTHRSTTDAADPKGTFAGDRAGRRSTSNRITILPSSRVAPKRHRDEEAEAEANSLPEKEEDADNLQAHQDYLVSRAFAHDDIDEDFVKQKNTQVETIMKPEDVNDNLPGWGEWGGEDPKLNRRHQERLAHSNTQRDIEKTFLMKSRADAALSHVIINHDGVELVPDRMTLHMVPRPFSNPEEFARSMRQPTGPEWSSSLSFKESIQPRVEVRQGNAVEPLDISLRRKVTKTKRRKTERTK
ncbi:U3 small nucleolar RNA-associated protein 14 [Strigomonas culicis]|uniref:U3 small nucleolar RNA-associated protein 14 n=1 Tax=Strigomonas culicis TaxID=28005 RepID=S9VNN1_9TRYP|nr:U3 small nucleolar RNA-associated protein 14 [Strigomonas culicis]|eukprot:EPY24900.1 U3 small nucleolar RNA-associated protein 14 [Strigomonas culicis]